MPTTIVKTQPSLGYKRSTALKLPDGRIGVLRIDRQTWHPSQTWRHPNGWLVEYESEGAWLHAMDRRRDHKLPAPPKAVSAWVNYVKYTQSLEAGRTYMQAMAVAKEAWASLDKAEKTRFKSTSYRPAVAVAPAPAPAVAVKPTPVCPVCEDTVPAKGRAGGDGSHRACLAEGFRTGTWSTIKQWEEACAKHAEPTVAQTKYSSNFTFTRASSDTLPAGQYYIGDLCYGMTDDVYDGVWGDKFGYNTGVFKSADRPDQVFAMGGTGGDGSFPGSDGHSYSVDAGIIGIMSVNLMKQTPEEFTKGPWYNGPPARIYTFKNPVHFEFDEAEVKFTFTDGETTIEIGGGYDEDEDDC